MTSLPNLPTPSASWIRTARLNLEPIRRVHAGVMYPILSDPNIYQFTGGSPPSSIETLAETYASWELRRSPDGKELWLNWLLREREKAAAIGSVQATIAENCTYIAWMVGTQWQRRGYASEAASALVRWLLALGPGEIRARVNPCHTASQIVAGRAGLRRTEQLNAGEEVWVLNRPPN